MRRGVMAIVAGAVLMAAPAGAQAGAVTAERAARAAAAPAQVHSVACFRMTRKARRAAIRRHMCVVQVASPADETCSLTVAVAERRRPRRVSARVLIPRRCFLAPPRPGQF